MKPLIRRQQADLDVQEAIDYYLTHAPDQALLFVDALEQSYRHIQRSPGTGSLRYAHDLNLPGVRFRICKKFPYLVFYIEKSDQIEIWRVLHGKRDIPAWMTNANDAL
jgi:toxin ParE1/3/4